MRIYGKNDVVVKDVNLSNGTLGHEWQNFKFDSQEIGNEIPPGSFIQFMHIVGDGDGH
jgi:hypothetical protein